MSQKIKINAENEVLGRLGSFVAKELLKGKSVEIFNSEKVIVSGRKENVVEKIRRKRKMGSGGSLKGPKYVRREDLLLKRMIRGMLPWDRARGREAFKRLRCFLGEEKMGEDAKRLNSKIPRSFVTMKTIVEALK